MAVSTRTRFEVFKRDIFTCQYCGRKTPEVVLHVDHVVAVANGGSDDISNLITACVDCNLGKSSVPLDEASRPMPDLSRAQELREREEQIQAYEEVRKAERERMRAATLELWDYWDELARIQWPNSFQDGARRQLDESAIRYWLGRFTVSDLKDAMDIAMSRTRSDWHGVPYTVGILKKWRDEGRN